MRVVFSAAAEKDLEDIGDYIARDNPRRAVTFVRELRAVSLQLSAQPRAFALISRYERNGVRRRPYGNYLIFYRVQEDHVAVVRVIHGARDYEAVLFPKD